MTNLEGRATLLPVDNIDTDRIIPARFLTTTDRNGLGRHLFEDWLEGSNALSNTSILVAGHNFGCRCRLIIDDNYQLTLIIYTVFHGAISSENYRSATTGFNYFGAFG